MKSAFVVKGGKQPRKSFGKVPKDTQRRRIDVVQSLMKRMLMDKNSQYMNADFVKVFYLFNIYIYKHRNLGEVDLTDEEAEMLDEVDVLFAQFPHDHDFDEGIAKLIDVMRDRFVRLLKKDRFKELLHGILGIDPQQVDLAMCAIIKEGGLSYKFWDKCPYEELKFVNDAVKFDFIKQHVRFTLH